MKCIVYVSRIKRKDNRVSVPRGLKEISEQSKIRNKQHGITGVLAYKSGLYLQVIEGKTEAVDQLFSSICHDDRHNSVALLFERKIEKRSFKGWSLKLMSGVRTDEEFISFVSDNHTALSNMPFEQRELFETFCYLDEGPNGRGRYANLDIWLDDWPAFVDETASAGLTELCNRLTLGQTSFEQLVTTNPLPTEDKLRKFLDLLLKKKLLKIKRASEPTTVVSLRRRSNDKRPVFERMKTLLRIA